MRWPTEIVRLFEAALEIEPSEGYTREQVLQFILDETARRTVWRAQNDPTRVAAALHSPYTPLGSVVPCGVDDRAHSLTIRGSKWGAAVDAYYRYVEENAVAIFAVFADEAEPYNDLI
jgi:hypothetical protein